MNPHPSDRTVADLIRHARLGAATTDCPARTRTVGAHSVRQCSAGRLVVEVARADSGVSEDVARARRETLAAELERRRMVDAAEEARRQAEIDRAHAERERDDAVARQRHHGGPDPDFLTLALIAAVTFDATDNDLAHVLDAAVTDNPDLSAQDTQDLAGERRVGLSAEQLNDELTATGLSPALTETMPRTGSESISPAQLVGQGLSNDVPAPQPTPGASLEPEDSPEIG